MNGNSHLPIDLNAVRARADISANAVVDDLSAKLRDRLTFDQVASRWYSSAQDVRGLLELIQHMQYTLDHEREEAKKLKDAVRMVVAAAHHWTYSGVRNEGELALIQAVQMIPWTVLDDLGIENEGG